MAFEKLQFTKSWTSAEDFPTYEPSEAQVRADLQLLHDEARDGLNKLVDALNDPAAAARLPFQGQGLTADNLQDAVLEVYEATQNAAAGQIVNGSVTKEKLAAAVLQRTYGGRPWTSMNTPGTAQTPDTDFPIGQVWLRPAFTVENLAGTEWSAAAGTVEAVDGGWKLTGDGSMAQASAAQSLTGLGTEGQRAFVSLRTSETDSQLTGLTLYLNGTAHDLTSGGGVYETVLNSQGGVEVVLAAQWPAAALAVGSVTVTHFAVVNADAAEAQVTDCEALSDWPSLLSGLVPFTAAAMPRAVYIQTAPGRWFQLGFEALPADRGGTGLTAVSKGQMLYADGANSMAALDPPQTDGSVLRFLEGRPAWSTEAQVIASLGSLRIQTGAYTGTGAAGTVDLPVKPKLLLIFPQSGPAGSAASGVSDHTILLGDGATELEIHSTTVATSTLNYYSVVSLSGNVLTFRTNPSTLSVTSPTPVTKTPDCCYGNRNGETYSWVAVY